MPRINLIEAVRQGLREEMARDQRVILMGEDVGRKGGVGGEVAAVIAEEAFEYLDGPVTRLAGPDAPAMAFAPTLEKEFLITPEEIADAARKLARY